MIVTAKIYDVAFPLKIQNTKFFQKDIINFKKRRFARKNGNKFWVAVEIKNCVQDQPEMCKLMLGKTVLSFKDLSVFMEIIL
jgi:hypothetical protein